jgi:hypothetical protein
VMCKYINDLRNWFLWMQYITEDEDICLFITLNIWRTEEMFKRE